ncbi:hypothetical protein ACWD7F_37970 [Streptomyces sp. NPDC005122]
MTWLQAEEPRGRVLERTLALPFTADSDANQHSRQRGLVKLLDWLEDQPGRTWQDRWLASGADEADPARRPPSAAADRPARAYACDACGLVLDRDYNAARNLAALAAACTTGTGVAGVQDAFKVSKPRGADQKTRVSSPSRKATARRAGGATLPRRGRTETRDRTQAEALTLWCCDGPSGPECPEC